MRLNKTVIICAAIVVILSLAVSPAFAQRNFRLISAAGDRASGQGGSDAAVSCKPVHGFIGSFNSLESCVHEGHFYEWCADFPVWGTLNGTLWYYTQPEMNREFDVPEGMLAESWSFVVASAVVVYHTKKGKIFAQDNALWHSAALGPEFAEFEQITGGTGQYEGATGWIAMAGGDVAIMTGEICTPVEN